MSIVFDGTTTKLEHTTADLLSGSTMTVGAWVFANSAGEANQGRVFCVPESGVTRLYHPASANTLSWVQDFNTTDGVWTFTAPDNQWNWVTLTYDRGSTANDPTARVNFTSATVTRVTAPVGTSVAWTGGFCIGNITGQNLTWDGRIAHLQCFPGTILTAQMQDQIGYRPGSVPATGSWFPLYRSSFLCDLRNTVATPTGTGHSTGEGPPCAPHHFMRAVGWQGIKTMAAGSAKPWLYYAHQRGA